jgi:type II secretory pathway pseudopilin PulG
MVEVIIVVSILGVLVAIISMSMVGLNARAHQRADNEEMMTIQSAMNFMLMDQGVDPEQACSLYPGDPGGVYDMARFPSDQSFQTSAGSGGTASHRPVQLYPHYLRDRYMHRPYVCTNGGTVTPAGT